MDYGAIGNLSAKMIFGIIDIANKSKSFLRFKKEDKLKDIFEREKSIKPCRPCMRIYPWYHGTRTLLKLDCYLMSPPNATNDPVSHADYERASRTSLRAASLLLYVLTKRPVDFAILHAWENTAQKSGTRAIERIFPSARRHEGWLYTRPWGGDLNS